MMPTDPRTALLEFLEGVIREADAATPGPWWPEGMARGVRHLERNWDTYMEEMPGEMNLPGRQSGDGGMADGTFIARSRTLTPALALAIKSQAERHYAAFDVSHTEAFDDATCACGKSYPCPTIAGFASALKELLK